MPAVHQLIPRLHAGDAIGHHTVLLRRALQDAGFDSEIFCEAVAPELEGEAHHWERYATSTPADLLVYQCSTDSPLTGFLLGRAEPVCVSYHNITPAAFFDRWEPGAAAAMRRARRQLEQLAARADAAVAMSAFNAAELERLGFPAPHVTPLLVDLESLEREPDEPTLDRLRGAAEGGAHWLFVGRVAPNKCQHDVVAAFAAYRRLYDPRARLSLVGGFSAELYRWSLADMVDELALGDAVEVAGAVSFGALRAYYRSADVFVSMSEHEGFCVPIVEAMQLSVPVVAHAAAAVPDTVGAAGVLLPGKDPATVATAVHRLLDDATLRRSMVDAGRQRAGEFSLDVTSGAAVEVVGRLADLPGG